MLVHLVDGTYELFRYHFALPSHETADGREVAAARGVLGSVIQLLEDGATHIGVATDHVITSFRNDLWDDYKDGEGTEPVLLQQFPLVEELLVAAGFCVWPMVEYEADDALAAAAAHAAEWDDVDRVLICTPDKDLAQCVREDGKVAQFDRRKGQLYDADGVREKFGVSPESIPDYLGLVGDSADGFPGLAGWGAKSASTVLAEYTHIEQVPSAADDWTCTVRGAGKLAATLQSNLELALLFRRIATVELDSVPQLQPTDVEWTGPLDGFGELCAQVDAQSAFERIERLLAQR